MPPACRRALVISIISIACAKASNRGEEHYIGNGVAKDGPVGDRDNIGMQRCCCVSFFHAGAEYSNTAMGCSLFDAAAKALAYFCSSHWKGPRPRRKTVLDVTILGDQRRYRVIASRIERWCSSQQAAARNG